MRNWSVILVGMLAGCTATKSTPEHVTMAAARAMPNPHMERKIAAHDMNWQIRQCLFVPPYGLGQHRSVTFDIHLSPTGEVKKLEDVTPKDRRNALLALAVERSILRCQPYYNVPANPLRLTVEAP